MLNIQALIADAKGFETVRTMRWPDGMRCPECCSAEVTKDGRDETQPERQRYQCRGCGKRFDDLSGTIFAGHHQPLRVWILGLYFMGLNLSNEMASQLREGIVERKPEVTLSGEVECDEVDVVAGHKGHAEAVRKTIAPGAVVYTDEYDIYARLPLWGYTHHTVCPASGEFARDDTTLKVNRRSPLYPKYSEIHLTVEEAEAFAFWLADRPEPPKATKARPGPKAPKPDRPQPGL